MFKETVTCIAIAAGLIATSAQARGEAGDRAAQFAQMDTDGDGKLTSAELATQATARFRAADSDGNGTLSRDELAARAQIMHTRRLLGRYDVDGDGALSAEELAQVGAGGADARINRRFARMDSDNSGTLSPSEMQARRDLAKMVERLDRDEDGAISLSEFEKARGHGRKMARETRDK